MGESDRTSQASDRTLFGVVLLVIGTLVLWAAVASQLGGEIGFVMAVLVGGVVASVVWRDRITFDLLSTIALFGVPVLVGGLALS